MSFIRVTAKVGQVKQFDRIFGKVQNVLEDFSPVFEEMKDTFYEEQQKLFAAEGGVDNLKPFAQLTDKYRLWKQRVAPGSKILELTGRLVDSAGKEGAAGNITIIEKNKMILGTDLQTPKGGYSLGRLHQYGTSKMSARPVLRLSNRVKKKWTDIIRRHLKPSNI